MKFLGYNFQQIVPSAGDKCSICYAELNVTDNVIGHIFAERIGDYHAFHLQCINRWFDTNRSCPLCRKLVVHPVLMAALRGSQERVRALLESGEGGLIDEDTRYDAIVAAIQSDANSEQVHQMVKDLLANGSISNYTETIIYVATVKNRCLDTINLFMNLQFFSPLMFNLTMAVAKGNERNDIVQALRLLKLNVRNNQHMMQDIENVEWAAFWHSPERVKELLEKGPINDDTRGAAIINAIQSDANSEQVHQMVTDLLANGPVSMINKGRAIYYAAEYNCSLDIINLLTQNWDVQAPSFTLNLANINLDLALEAAQRKGRNDIVEVLLMKKHETQQ